MELPSNSKMTKDKPLPVVSGDVKLRSKKKSEFTKFKDHLIKDELPKTKNHILYDIFVPKLKQMLLDSFAALLGGSYSSNTNNTQPRQSRVRTSYDNYYPNSRRTARQTRPIGRVAPDYDDILFETRPEAMAVLFEMTETMKRDGSVSISDMYAFAGITQCPATYVNWGWMLNSDSDLRGYDPNTLIRREDGEDGEKYYIIVPPMHEQIR